VLRPAFAAAPEVQMICREAPSESLFELLGQHEVDLVITDRPASGTPLRAYNHVLGESGTTFFAVPAVAASLRKRFPESLDGASMLLPGENTQIRQALELWLDSTGIKPRRVGEFDDLALMTAFGRAGSGVFPGPTAIEREIESEYHVRVVGRLPEVKERFYAVTAERKIKNPMVSAITSAARREVFDGGLRE
jgi:LysR family transcriptional activator of nhaA